MPQKLIRRTNWGIYNKYLDLDTWHEKRKKKNHSVFLEKEIMISDGNISNSAQVLYKKVVLTPATLLQKKIWPTCFPVNFESSFFAKHLGVTTSVEFWLNCLKNFWIIVPTYYANFKNMCRYVFVDWIKLNFSRCVR